MRRLRSLGAGLALLLALAVGAPALAQDATPEVIEPDLSGEMTFLEFADFGVVDVATMPAAPVSLVLFRIEFAPGAGVEFPPGDPGLGIHLVQSGTLTLHDFDTDIVVTRAASQATPEAEMQEILPAGQEAQLAPGDGFLWPPMAAGAIMNQGSEPVVLLISNIYPPTDEQADADAPIATPAP